MRQYSADTCTSGSSSRDQRTPGQQGSRGGRAVRHLYVLIIYKFTRERWPGWPGGTPGAGVSCELEGRRAVGPAPDSAGEAWAERSVLAWLGCRVGGLDQGLVAGIGCAAARNRLGRTGVSKFGRREAHSFGVLGRLESSGRPCHLTGRRGRGLCQHPWIHPEPSWFLRTAEMLVAGCRFVHSIRGKSFGRFDGRLG